MPLHLALLWLMRQRKQSPGFRKDFFLMDCFLILQRYVIFSKLDRLFVSEIVNGIGNEFRAGMYLLQYM